MAKTLEVDPFPALTWDGWHWRGQCALPWYSSAGGVSLIVRADCSRSAEGTKPAAAPPPTAEQAEAFRLLLDLVSPTAAALLATLRESLPELPSTDWGAAGEHLEFAELIVFVTSAEGVAYTGFVFNSMEHEHGIGVVAHRNRVAHIGNAEEADESAAEKDVRRLKRGKRTGN